PHPLLMSGSSWDMIVVAVQPSARPPMDIISLGSIAGDSRDALLVQFSGEIDRSSANYFELKLWPLQQPDRGEYGLPFAFLGVEASLRKLVGGLKAAEDVFGGGDDAPGAIARIVKSGGKTR